MKQRLHAFRIGVAILALVSTTMAMSAPVHKVTQGDSLWSISRRYHVSIDSIKHANGVSSNKPLKLGSALVIPSEKTTASSDKLVQRFGVRIAHKINQKAAVIRDHSQGKTDIVRTALACRGSRYVRGGTGRNGFDCSGFTSYVYAKHGVSLPHQSGAQSHVGKSVNKSALKAGDLVFFSFGRRGISHVGLYVGNRRFVHASTPRRGVIVSSLDEACYARTYRCARRIAQKSWGS